ncbi:MAG: methionine biosynthesis protein MetW [Actinomycetia bacterium]|nr:methionine biosynthesis protein MetW [Actinomycetes bacterium]
MIDTIFLKWVDKNSKVLVLGCGSGQLQQQLIDRKGANCFGLDISEQKVVAALSKGLSVIQGDINQDLTDYPPSSFDMVLAHDILQLTNNPKKIIKDILRIGDKAIVSFPNFAYIKIRLSILFTGRMPNTRILPYKWYETPNIHLFTVKDFQEFCREEEIQILDQNYTVFQGKKSVNFVPNLTSEFAYFLISSSG